MALGFAYTTVSNVFSNAFHTYQGELFPTSLRATAAMLVLVVDVAVLGPPTTGRSLEAISPG